MLLILFLILLSSCNKINNLGNKYKFRLNEMQEESIKEGNIEALKNFMNYYGRKKKERSYEGEVPILYIIKHFNIFHPSQKEQAEKIILEHIKPYIEDGDWIEYDKKRNTPLHYCLKKNYFEIAKALLEKTKKFDIDIQAIRNEEKDNPLYLAIEQENYKFINLFLEHMENINKPFKYILTPLIFSALLGRDNVVKLLIEKGAVIKDVTDLRMLTASDLSKELKQELAENYIKSLNQENFESALWVFEASRANNFNLTIEHINEEINPKKAFRHYWDQELETKKQEIKPIFDKYNIKKIRIKEMLKEAKVYKEEESVIEQNKGKKKIFHRILKKLRIKY